jgi:hypothetical protein
MKKFFLVLLCCSLVCCAFAKEKKYTTFEFGAGARSMVDHAMVDVHIGFWFDQNFGLDIEAPFWAYTKAVGKEFYTSSVSLMGRYKLLDQGLFDLYALGKIGFTHAKDLEYSLNSNGEIKQIRANDGRLEDVVLSTEYGFGGNIDVGIRATVNDIFFFDVCYALTLYYMDSLQSNHWFGFAFGVME